MEDEHRIGNEIEPEKRKEPLNQKNRNYTGQPGQQKSHQKTSCNGDLKKHGNSKTQFCWQHPKIKIELDVLFFSNEIIDNIVIFIRDTIVFCKE